MAIKVLNEFLPVAETENLGAIKVGDTLKIENEVLDVSNTGFPSNLCSNCITKIPQTVKLELNDGYLTIKAGTIVYTPDGTAHTIATDITSGTERNPNPTTDGTYIVFAGHITSQTEFNTIRFGKPEKICSGSTDSLADMPEHTWYDTTANEIKHYSDSEINGIRCLPLAKITVTNSTITSIDQVFNGAGYIGHHVFVLPGVEGYAGNGIAEDSTLKSIHLSISEVGLVDLTWRSDGTVATDLDDYIFGIRSNYTLQIFRYRNVMYHSELVNIYGIWQFVEEDNIGWAWNNVDTFDPQSKLCIANVSMKNSIVTYFDIIQPVRILNSNTPSVINSTYLFDYRLADHTPNKLSWVDSTTFSWQSGNVYRAAYNELFTQWHAPGSVAETENGVTYRRTTKGYKIALANREAAIINAYEKYGTGWFYIFDPDNVRFKLPRLSHGELIDSYIDNTTKSWYRLYADGWIEQGNTNTEVTTNGQTINLVKAMRNSIYSLDITGVSGTDETSTSVGIYGSAYTRNTNSFTVYTGDDASFNSGYISWTAKGYVAEGPDTTPYQHLYFYLGYTNAEQLSQAEIDINVKAIESKNEIEEATEEGIARLNNDSNALNRTQVSNCITEIPQDIKFTINTEHHAVLSSGSKLYVPDGFESDGTTPKFTSYTLPTTKTNYVSDTTTNERYVWYNPTTGIMHTFEKYLIGTTPPAAGTHNVMFWDLTDNIIKFYNDGTLSASGYALPIARVKADGENVYGKVLQVFNGIGYIGSTIFTLPGIKGLIPNGRNADGTLNSIEFTTTDVKTIAFNSNCNSGYVLLNTDGLTGGDKPFYYNKAKEDLIAQEATYIEEENRLYRYGVSTSVVYEPLAILVATFSIAENKIFNFNSKLAFSVLDQSAIEKLSTNGLPDASGIITLGGEGTFTAPANGWVSAICSYTYKVMVKNLTCKIYNGGTHNTPNEEAGSVPCNAGDSIEVSGNSEITTYFIPMKS